MGFVAKRLNEFSIGQFIITKVQWTVSIVILLKVFDAGLWIYIVTIPLILIMTWIAGVYVHRKGLWDSYVKESLKRGLR